MSDFAHPIPAEWLSAYHDGELDTRQRLQVDAHLAECPECRLELAALQSLRQTLTAAALPAVSSPDAFWSGVQARLPARQPAPAAAPVTTRRVLLHWSPGIALLLLNGAVQVAAVAGAAYLALAMTLQWTPAWANGLLQLATGFTLGLPAWLLPANWGGWELFGFWLFVSVNLAVLYLAWLAFELRYGPLALAGRAMLRGD